MNRTKMATALGMIASGFNMLAEAVAAEPLTSADTGDPVDDLPANPEKPEDPPAVELADLQELGAQIIKLGRKNDLLEIFKDMGVKNLSGIQAADRPGVYTRMLRLTKAAE